MDKNITFTELTPKLSKVFEKDTLIGYLGLAEDGIKYQAYDKQGNKIGRACLKASAIKKLFKNS